MNHAPVWPLCLALVGCQHPGYAQYADSMARIAEAQASVQREQAQMVMQLAQYSADPGVKMAAVFMLGISGGNGWGGRQFQQPQPPQDQVLEWVRALAGPVSNIALGLWAYKANKHSTDAASQTTMQGYKSLQETASAGFEAVKNGGNVTTTVTETNTTNQTSYSIGQGPGVIGSGSVVINPPPVVPPIIP